MHAAVGGGAVKLSLLVTIIVGVGREEASQEEASHQR